MPGKPLTLSAPPIIPYIDRINDIRDFVGSALVKSHTSSRFVIFIHSPTSFEEWEQVVEHLGKTDKLVVPENVDIIYLRDTNSIYPKHKKMEDSLTTYTRVITYHKIPDIPLGSQFYTIEVDIGDCNFTISNLMDSLYGKMKTSVGSPNIVNIPLKDGYTIDRNHHDMLYSTGCTIKSIGQNNITIQLHDVSIPIEITGICRHNLSSPSDQIVTCLTSLAEDSDIAREFLSTVIEGHGVFETSSNCCMAMMKPHETMTQFLNSNPALKHMYNSCIDRYYRECTKRYSSYTRAPDYGQLALPKVIPARLHSEWTN